MVVTEVVDVLVEEKPVKETKNRKGDAETGTDGAPAKRMSMVKQGVRAALRRAVEGGRRGAPLAGAGRVQGEGGGRAHGRGAVREQGEREVVGERGGGRRGGVKKIKKKEF